MADKLPLLAARTGWSAEVSTCMGSSDRAGVTRADGATIVDADAVEVPAVDDSDDDLDFAFNADGALAECAADEDEDRDVAGGVGGGLRCDATRGTDGFAAWKTRFDERSLRVAVASFPAAASPVFLATFCFLALSSRSTGSARRRFKFAAGLRTSGSSPESSSTGATRFVLFLLVATTSSPLSWSSSVAIADRDGAAGATSLRTGERAVVTAFGVGSDGFDWAFVAGLFETEGEEAPAS